MYLLGYSDNIKINFIKNTVFTIHIKINPPPTGHYVYVKKKYTLDLRMKFEMGGKYHLGGVKFDMNYSSDIFQYPTIFPLISDKYDLSPLLIEEN